MSAPTETQKPLIILAEDEQGIANLTKAILSDKYEIHHHESGVGALAELKSLKAEIDAGRNVILITDNNMPQMKGVELMKALVTEQIIVPTVFATSETEAAQSVPFLVDALLQKPYRPAELRAAVESAVQKYETLPKAKSATGEESRRAERPDIGALKQ